MLSQQLNICNFGPSSFRPVAGKVLVEERVPWWGTEMFGQHRAWRRLNDGRLGLYGRLETANGFLLEDIPGEEEKGGEDED